jgi:hypothetical protein
MAILSRFRQPSLIVTAVSNAGEYHHAAQILRMKVRASAILQSVDDCMLVLVCCAGMLPMKCTWLELPSSTLLPADASLTEYPLTKYLLQTM